MLSFEMGEQFAAYLRESMTKSTLDKFGDVCRGIKEEGVSHLLSRMFKDKSDDARNLLFRQKQLLKVAETLLEQKPWITYFAATKHVLYLRSLGIDSSAFSDFKDKEYVLDVEQYAEALAVSAEKRLDEETQNYLHELIELQQITPLIRQALEGLHLMRDTSVEARKAFINPPQRSLMNELFNPFAPSHGKQDVKNIGFAFSSSFIKAAAFHLGQRPEDWIRSPDETIRYLAQFNIRRAMLEDTYFPL